MKGFETENRRSESVDNWTLPECNDYLCKYPKGLKAERVKNRIAMLSSLHNKEKKALLTATNPKVINNNTTQQSTNLCSDSFITFLKIIATIFLVGAGIFIAVGFFEGKESKHVLAGYCIVILIPALTAMWK